MSFKGEIGEWRSGEATEKCPPSSGGYPTSPPWPAKGAIVMKVLSSMPAVGSGASKYIRTDCGGTFHRTGRASTSSEWMQALDVTLGIRGPEGVENKRGRIQEFSYDDDRACFWFEFCRRSKLKEQNSRLMPGNVLIFSLDLKGVVPSVDRDSSTQTVEEAREDEVPTDEKQGVEKALEDFGTLLDSGENSDVTVQVGDVEFKVHSLILFARSAALSISLRHESKEKASNKILLEDTEPGAFRAYLQYLYTGSVRSLTEQNVFDLYRLADKYLADDLKFQCLKHVRSTLSVRTFCDTIKLALTHGEGDLLERALDFAKENIQLIIVSVEWQNFVCDHPREANEILVKCFGPRS